MYTGADLTLLDTDGLGVKLLTHPGLRAINAESVTAVPDNSVINASAHPLLQTWRTDYGNGTMLLALFNLDDQSRNMRWYAPQRRPFRAAAVLQHVQRGKPYSCESCSREGATGEIVLPAHASLLLRLSFGGVSEQ